DPCARSLEPDIADRAISSRDSLAIMPTAASIPTPPSRATSIGVDRSAHGEDTLHAGLGVAGDRAQVRKAPLPVEGDDQLRRLAPADEPGLLAADGEVVRHGADVVEAEGDRLRL